MIVVCTDYMEHGDDGWVKIIYFHFFIGRCEIFHFTFSGQTSNIDALTKLQYAL